MKRRVSAVCSALYGKAKALPRRVYDYCLSFYQKHDSSYLALCFALPFLLMLLVYVFMGAWPFGFRTVLTLDLNGQYIYFFEALRDCVWGDKSLLYSFSRALGGEFLGIYAYYLASPLSYIVALFPKENMTEAIFFMLVLKCGLSGLSFGYFLKKTTSTEKMPTVLFSAVYALSGYAVVMQHNTMWIDNLILLPLIAVGLYSLIREGKYKLYTLSLALAILSNFYIGYMTCIFTLFYFLYQFFSLSKEERNPRGIRYHLPRTFFRFGAFSLIAGAIGSLIVIPAAYSLTFGKNTFTDPNFDFYSKFDLVDFLSGFLFDAYDTVRPEGLPIVYCSIFVLLLIPYFYLNRDIKPREKIGVSFLIFLLVFSFSFNTVDLIWHGFQAPNWLNYRYSYMLSFLMVTMAAKGFSAVSRHRSRTLLLSALPWLFLVVLGEHFELRNLEEIYLPVICTIACFAVYIAVFSWFLCNRDRKDIKSLSSFYLCLLVCLELFLGGLCNMAELTWDVGIATRDSYVKYEERWADAINTVKAGEDDPFYRFEKLSGRNLNDPYMFGIRGLSGSTSTLNRETIYFLNRMGHYSASHTSRYTGTNPFTDSFLSVKYVAGDQKTVFPASYRKVYDNGDVVVYKNPHALSVAFGVSESINGITFVSPDKDTEEERQVYDYVSPFERMNALASALIGEECKLFQPIKYTYSGQNSKYNYSSSYKPIDPSKKGVASFTVTAPKDGELYAYFPVPYYRYTTATWALNGVEKDEYFTDGTTGYLCLGTYQAGESCTVSFTFGEDGINIDRYADCFFYLDKTVYDRVIGTLSSSSYEVEECTEDFFSGKITVKEGQQTILTTIPYDAGWQVEVDGERIETYKTLDALIAFDLTPGTHTLTLRYFPNEYRIALWITAGGGGIFISIVVLEFFLKKKRKGAAMAAGKDTAYVLSSEG